MPGLKERAKTLIELSQGAEFLYADGPPTADEAAAKMLTPEARSILAGLVEELSKREWKAADLEAATRDFAAAKGLKLGQAAQPLRAALTGRTVSPPIFEMLQILGKEESLARLTAYTS
jgi:glutamyl-tRNA synthetase